MVAETLHFPYEIPPAPGEWLEVADGIYWLRFPLPLALNHVHAWLIREPDGWFCIDSGWGGQLTHELWDRIIAEKLDGQPITRLLVTHYHPDHIGSAGYLYEKFQPQLLMTQTEWLMARALALDTGFSLRDVNDRHYHAMGLPDALRVEMLAGGNGYAKAVDLPPGKFTPLRSGETININGDAWRVLVGGGHAPAQVSLYCAVRDIYIAADQVLPRISPNVSVWGSSPQIDALAEYQVTLVDIRAQTNVAALALPSHNLPFTGLHDRIDALLQHHDERLEEIAGLCRPAPLTVFQIAQTLFQRPLDRTQTTFAIGEVLAHVNRLLALGELEWVDTGENSWQFAAK